MSWKICDYESIHSLAHLSKQRTAQLYQATLSQERRASVTCKMNTLNDFEDDNPFEQEGPNVSSEASSTSQVAIFESASPPQPTQPLSPTSQNMDRPPFPSSGSHKAPQANFKSDFCCSTDRYLHSGEDVEILVCVVSSAILKIYISAEHKLDCGCPEDVFEFEFTLYYLRHKNGSTPLLSTGLLIWTKPHITE